MKKRVARKQRELVGLAEGEEEEETQPRSLVSATAVAAPQEAGTPDAGPQEVAWHQGEPGSYQQACPDGQVWGEQQGAERRQQGQALELGEVKVAGGRDIRAVIRLEAGEQTPEKSIGKLSSFQDRRRGGIRMEEATTQGPRMSGSREELELKVVEATKKV